MLFRSEVLETEDGLVEVGDIDAIEEVEEGALAEAAELEADLEADLAEDLATDAAQPVLSEADFQTKLRAFESALATG